MTVTIDTVKQGKKIGQGIFGSVYLAKGKNGNSYAIKIEHILETEIKQNYKYNFWREVEFANTMNELYPLHFMKLYDYKIDPKCTYKTNWDKIDVKLSDFPKDIQKQYKKLWSSKYCATTLYSFVDTTLSKVIESWKVFDDVIFYDLFIQLVYVIYLMDKEGYVHQDLHPNNIGINFTQTKTINIFGSKIPTHGMYVVILDYATVLHKKYILTNAEKKVLANENDLFVALNFVYDFEDFAKYYHAELFTINSTKWCYRNPANNIDALHVKLLEEYLKNLSLDKDHKAWLQSILFKVLYFHLYEKQVLDKIETKIKEPIHYFEPRLYIPTEAIVFAIGNIYNIDKVVKYLIKNRL